jgi:hypothetical protein
MVEHFFRDLTEKQLRRGIFRNLEELLESIGEYIDNHNRRPKPFIWTAKASTSSKRSSEQGPPSLIRYSG